MNETRLRRQIASEAARLLFFRQVGELHRAKLLASRRFIQGNIGRAELPTNGEVQDEIAELARRSARSGDHQLRELRQEALHWMEMFWRFRPRLSGAVLAGIVTPGVCIDLHAFTDRPEEVLVLLEHQRIRHETEHHPQVPRGQEQPLARIKFTGKFPVELTLYPLDLVHHTFQSFITGQPIERADIHQLRQQMREVYADGEFQESLEETSASLDLHTDRFDLYRSLLAPLEQVKENRRLHPEGDALYHSLQVFDLACEELPYDEEFLLAALLHDVGKAIDPLDSINAGLEALGEAITPRTIWLIENLPAAHEILAGDVGARARRRLSQTEDYEELMLLARCDRDGRQRGVPASEIEEAIKYVKELSQECEEG